jgi:tetratricopeptide (TPR) repeat protein
MAELQADLRHYLADEPVHAKQTVGRWRAWVANNALAVGVGAAGLAVVAVLLVAGLMATEGSSPPKPDVRRGASERQRPAAKPEREEELPAYAQGAWDLAKAKVAEENYDEAIEQLSFLVRELSDRPTLVARLQVETADVLIARARADLVKKDRWTVSKEARADFDRAVELTPDRGETHLARGNAFFEVGMRSVRFFVPEAEESESTDAEDGAHPGGFRGTWRRDVGKRAFKPASESLRRGLELVPDDTEARYALGVCLYHLGAWAKAIVEFDQAIAAREGYAAALFCRGLAQAALKQDELAVKDSTRSQACFPPVTEAHEAHRQSFCYLAAAVVNLRMGRLDAAQANGESVLNLIESGDMAGRARRLLDRVREAR